MPVLRIWTDVEGCYNCDPRLVPDAYLLKTLSIKGDGALLLRCKVLPKTIAPVAQFHIPCLSSRTASTLRVRYPHRGRSGDDDLKVKAISDLSGMCMFNVSGPGMKGMVGMAGRIFSARLPRRGQHCADHPVVLGVQRRLLYPQLRQRQNPQGAGREFELGSGLSCWTRSRS